MVSANNPINNKVGSSISGVTNTFTVTNPSNTASSAARETITVGGGTAADPTLNFNVSGVTNWEMGIDNSVNDNLTISQGTALGTNDVWRMTTAGIRTMPLQPCFLAVKSAQTANVTGDGTVYTMIADSEIFDQGSNYNNATGVFTAPLAGRYRFEANFNISGVTSAMVGCQTFLTATSSQFAMNQGNAANIRDLPLGNMSIYITALFDLSAGDTVVSQFELTFGAKVVDLNGTAFGAYRSWFSGYLVY